MVDLKMLQYTWEDSSGTKAKDHFELMALASKAFLSLFIPRRLPRQQYVEAKKSLFAIFKSRRNGLETRHVKRAFEIFLNEKGKARTDQIRRMLANFKDEAKRLRVRDRILEHMEQRRGLFDSGTESEADPLVLRMKSLLQEMHSGTLTLHQAKKALKVLETDLSEAPVSENISSQSQSEPPISVVSIHYLESRRKLEYLAQRDPRGWEEIHREVEKIFQGLRPEEDAADHLLDLLDLLNEPNFKPPLFRRALNIWQQDYQSGDFSRTEAVVQAEKPVEYLTHGVRMARILNGQN